MEVKTNKTELDEAVERWVKAKREQVLREDTRGELIHEVRRQERDVEDAIVAELEGRQNGPERDPRECHYCDLCSRPIREKVFGKERVWVAEGGTMFCRTSDDKNSLVGHRPRV